MLKKISKISKSYSPLNYFYFKGALKEKLRIYGTSHLELLTRLALVVYFLCVCCQVQNVHIEGTPFILYNIQ